MKTIRNRKFFRKATLLIVFCLFFLSFYSCKTYKSFNINVLEPAEIVVPQSIQKVLVAHSIVETDSNRKTPYEIYNSSYYDTVFYDTAAAEAALINLAGILNYNPRFEAVLPDSLQVQLPSDADQFTYLHLDKTRDLCNDYQTDALLLLSWMDKKIKYDIFSSYLGGYYSIYTIYLKTKWMFIDPFRSKFIDQILLTDTLYYQIDGYWGTSEEGLYLTGRELIRAAAEETGLRYGSRITPHFVESGRIIFKSGDKYLRKGFIKAEEGKWKEAAMIWQNTLNRNNSAARARASFNIALANEMEGLLEPAIEWANHSYSYFQDSINYTYLSILKERLLQQEKLILQMEGENQ